VESINPKVGFFDDKINNLLARLKKKKRNEGEEKREKKIIRNEEGAITSEKHLDNALMNLFQRV
jgi:hypothetical protein